MRVTAEMWWCFYPGIGRGVSSLIGLFVAQMDENLCVVLLHMILLLALLRSII
jgi:hypothetical protein